MTRLRGVRDPGDDYRLRRREKLFEGKIFRIFRDEVTLPNGVEAVYETLRYPAAVAIIPVLEEEPGRREVLLVEQFRNAIGGYVHEVPAGMLAEGEEPLACARRELEEETGYVAGKWTHITTLYPTPGISGERMVYFLAQELRPTGKQNLEPTECLQVKRFPLDGLIDSMVRGQRIDGIPSIVDGKTHVAVFYLGALYGGGGR